MKILHYLGRSFADTLLLLFGVTGVTFSLMSAYAVPADDTQCFLFCLLFSAVFSFLFHIRAHGRLVCVAALLLFAVFLILYRVRLFNATLAFLSVLTDTIRENTSLNISIDAGTASYGVLLYRLNEFFCFLPALLTCIFGLFWIRLRSFLLCLLIAAPLMGLCVVLIDAAPDLTPFLLFAIFCVVCVCSGYLRRSHGQRTALATCVLLPLATGFVLLVTVLFPAEGYVRSSFGEQLFSFFEQVVTLRYDQAPSHEPGIEFSVPDTSGSSIVTPTVQPLQLTGVDAPHYTGQTVLSLTTQDFTGPLLLRGYSLAEYTGSAWEPADDIYANLPPDSIQTFTSSVLRFSPDSVRHTLTVRPIHASDRKSIAYTPYFYSSVTATDSTFSGDSALYAMSSPGADYHFYTPGLYYIDNHPNIVVSMQPYSAEMLDRYRSVDDETALLLRSFFADGIASLETMSSENERIEALAELIRNCASYNAQVSAYPRDTDFVRYFLIESGEGRCVHFATTATLLFRTMGYPARFVSGYSAVVEGTFTLVSDYAAHAWTEIWIDGLGWIPVDVTPPEYRDIGGDDLSQAESAHISSNTDSGSISQGTSSFPLTESGENAASSSAASSAVSAHTSGETGTGESELSIPQPAVTDTGVWKTVLISAGVLLAVLLSFALRRFLAANRRKKAFMQPDTKRAAISAWQYIQALAVYGLTVDASVYALVQKAAFSRTPLTAEEAKHVVDYACENARRIDTSLGFFGKIAFRYIKALY